MAVTVELNPITRTEMFMAKAAGQNVNPPEPITREEMFLAAIANNAGGGGGGSAYTTEEWTFTLEDGSEVVKKVVLA